MPKKKEPKPVDRRNNHRWKILTRMIEDYAQCSIAESWKGGGDPADMETVTLRLKFSRAQLNAQIEKMSRE